MEKLTTRKEYDETKARLEELITEATAKGLLEPDMDNAYTQEIAALSRLMAAYEDEYLNILPLRQKSPLIATIEDFFYTHGLKQKDAVITVSTLFYYTSLRHPLSRTLDLPASPWHSP